MPKVRAFDLSPLPADAQASLEALGQKIAATRKAQGLSQRDMAAKIGISPQTMLFVEQGRPNVQIGHYARALSALAAGVLSSLAPRVANHFHVNVALGDTAGTADCGTGAAGTAAGAGRGVSAA